MKTYVIKNQKDLEKHKDEFGYHIKGNAEFEINGIMEFDDQLKIDGYLYIKAGGSIKAGEFIKAGGSIEAGEFIKAGGSIEAGWYIDAGGYIKAGEFIKAKQGITAFLHITCKLSLNVGLRIFAGVCNWRNITDKDKTITCKKLENGEIAYGILNETGLEKEKLITLSNGAKVSE